MIRVNRLERLGNLLWQYAVGRALAEKWNYELDALPICWFDGTREAVNGEKVLSPIVVWEGQWPRDAYTGRKLERNEIENAAGAQVHLRGWFQRFELIDHVRDEVRSHWFNLNSPLPVRPADDLLICIRLTDYLQDEDRAAESIWAASTLRESEVRFLAAHVPHKSLHFVTDEPTHPIFTRLADLRGKVFAEGGMADFYFIHSFQKVAICQSTFHWWAAFLGAAKEIYFPPLNRGLWGDPQPAEAAWQPGHHGIDVCVPNDRRYIYDWWQGVN